MVHIGGIILYQGNNKPWHVGFTIVIYTTVLLRQRHTILKGYNSSKISIIWCLPAMTNELNTKYKKVEIYDLMFNNSFQLKNTTMMEKHCNCSSKCTYCSNRAWARTQYNTVTSWLKLISRIDSSKSLQHLTASVA